uniref:carbonyl reductase (NADPH) n=1 Tax=Schistosoma japonicum TaxID=6182 RepID=C1LRC9_SCHJA|nr:carbonyl reductase 1 [Schistosoma japonicum]CAX77258.1 carbonyl reductase 1 [Schistosoma japonicum]CAX77263.1 carbonyl reductase 1 [Schistosoma japonicum]
MKLAFVTGSNKGIGYNIVEKLAEFYGESSEWDIYLTARNVELGLEAVKKLSGKGLDVKFHQLDITDRDSRKAFLTFVKTNYPNGINVAVNNAGIAYKAESTTPFGEQARVTINTNFTSTIDFTEEFIPLLAEHARVVNVSSSLSLTSLKNLRNDLYEKFVGPMNLIELRKLMSEFVKAAEDGTCSEKGWPSTAYEVSKLGLTKASFIFGEMLKNDPRGIVINSCCPGYCDTDMTSHKGTKTSDEGADTPFYLATLPIGTKEPVNQFVYERKVVNWCK